MRSGRRRERKRKLGHLLLAAPFRVDRGQSTPHAPIRIFFSSRLVTNVAHVLFFRVTASHSAPLLMPGLLAPFGSPTGLLASASLLANLS